MPEDTDIVVSQLPTASAVNSSDLVMLTQVNAQAETGYDTKKGTFENVAKKVVNGIEYETLLADFPQGKRNPTDALNELRNMIIGQFPIKTVSGAIANFSTSLELPLVACKAQIVPKQASGTPTPSSPLPISGSDEVVVTHTGKNLFDPSISSNINTGITIWGLSDVNIVNFFNNLPVGNYRLSFKIRVDAINGSGTYRYGIILANSSSGNITMRYDETNVVVGSIFERSANVNVTASNKGLFTNFWFYCGRSTVEGTDKCTFYDFQLEVGNTQTTYEPYTATTYTKELPHTVYGGEVDVISGSGMSDSNIIDLGDLTWTYTSGDHSRMTATLTGSKGAPSGQTFKGACSIYKTAPYNSIYNHTEDKIIGISDTGTVWVYDSNYTDGTTFKNDVTGQKLVYELATPTPISTTPTEIKSKSGTNNIYSDTGDVEVKFRLGVQEYIDEQIATTQALIL